MPRLVHVRTPTYRRPEMLHRALTQLQGQTHAEWVCEILDDDPEQSAREVLEAFSDHRIHYRPNRHQRFASANIDQCFTRENPFDAEFFFVLEDDNQILPTFMAENISACDHDGVEIVLRNQFMEHNSGSASPHRSAFGILDGLFEDQVYHPDLFRLSLITDIGVSNGGLFWSRRSVSPLEIARPCNATAQEYMRTFSIAEPIRVAMKPLAVWAENGAGTTRDLGGQASYLRRELDLKRTVQALQRQAWSWADPDLRRAYRSGEVLRCSPRRRKDGLAKALIDLAAPLSRQEIELVARGVMIRIFGRLGADFQAFMATCENARNLKARTRQAPDP